MFQSFAVSTRPEAARPRVAMLRATIRERGIDAFLLPRADMFQGEYVAACDAHLAWLTGFTGSAGFVLVTQDRAALFVDGRYRVQARAEVDSGLFEVIDWPAIQAWDWLTGALPGGGILGHDPWLTTVGEIERLGKHLGPLGFGLLSCGDIVDACWQDRPPPPSGRMSLHPDDLAGESAATKRARLAEGLRKAGQRAALICSPDSLSWLLNIRGSDIPRVPVVQGYAILHDDARVDVFVRAGAAAPAQFGSEVLAALGPEVRVQPLPDGYEAAIRTLQGRVLADKTSLPQAVAELMAEGGTDFSWGRDPCLLPKARKNATEIVGARAAHLRDGAAMAEFLAWLDAQEPESLTEIDVVTRLEGFRQATGRLRDISFDTIAGSGPNGAIVHYRVTEATNRRLAHGEVLLVDSGG
ncbi:MAG: X-Pro aminopeptidase, partial [Alphaproteobacteria bacterium HGW-Alphaproteobacteria-2]